jgi:hypothetical protein
MTFINQWFVTSCMGARAVMGSSGWSDGGSNIWDIEIPAFDKASLYQLGSSVGLPLYALARHLIEHDPDDVVWTGEGTGGRGHLLRFTPLE